MYFSAIGFIYDVKKGPFWEHSPILFDISGVKAGWAKINKVIALAQYLIHSNIMSGHAEDVQRGGTFEVSGRTALPLWVYLRMGEGSYSCCNRSECAYSEPTIQDSSTYCAASGPAVTGSNVRNSIAEYSGTLDRRRRIAGSICRGFFKATFSRPSAS